MDLAALRPLIEAEAEVLKAAGVARGDRVGWIGLNHPSMLACLLACEAIGAALVPLNWRLAPAELQWISEDAGLRLVREGPPSGATAPRPAGIPVRREDGTLLLAYTSGTTGNPKGAMLSAAALRANAAHARAVFGLSPQDHVLTVLPLFHVGGLNIQTLPALLLGARVTLHGRFDAEAFLDAVERKRPTLSLVVPAVMRALVAHPRWEAADLSSLRAVGAGSSDVPPELIAAFHAKGVPVQQVYGLTESAPIAVAQTREEALAEPGSIGHAIGDCAARIARRDGNEALNGEEGEIQLRGPNLFSGYWNADAATAEAFTADGWFRTGDLGRRDASGRFWFTDRLKHLIISGGENIAPAEVERVLMSAPGVRECAVVGRPDPRWGEVPVAVIVPGAGFDADAVLRHCEGRLARFKHPRAVVTVGALPRTSLGKVQVAALRALIGAG
ncbi:class I adenylate-forming enzyme family protein [Sabulicella rubraurantiaca]|uniref:class I adenylate-forming enzyme family protein n=1 Tax=Sabulicella rubraurantiaca TaxID=2811429 RepID=UPI001A965A70|nr:AMP-binding protein [Sabulicella rubraurantiaca]